MTSTVTQLIHCVDNALITRLFMKFKARYGTLWTSRASSDEQWEFIIDDWREELEKFHIDAVRAAFNKTLSTYKEFPPTLGQVVDLCMKESGVPSVQEVIRLMVARDFSHPLVKMVYDKMGSWTLTNGKEEDIHRKAKEHYAEARADFHTEPAKQWARLEEYHAKPKELPPPDKIPTNEERRGFKERMADYQQKVDEEKGKLKDDRQREFDYSKLKPGGRDFDKLLFSEYRAYLIGIPETMVLSLSVQDAYARMKFLSMVEQEEHLKKSGYVPNSQREEVQAPKTSDRNGRPTKIYKSWTND